jgi:tRNA (guanine-N7-)-methyltransferase
MSEHSDPPRDVPGALHGSRLVTLPHVRPHVERCQAFVSGEARVLVEVGFDHGRRLHATARENPGWHVLGLEVRQQRVQEAMARAERDGVDNVLAWRMDARTVFAAVLPPSTVDIVEVLFPTPWWNTALRKKRLLFDDHFVADVARVLRSGGILHTATDVQGYAETIDACLARHPDFLPLTLEEGTALRPACQQQSRREWSCTRDGVPWAVRFWRLESRAS